MCWESDIYERIRKIKQGEYCCTAQFEKLANWIDQQYGVHTLDVIYSINNSNNGVLNIIVDTDEEKNSFYIDNFTIKRSKQKAILKQFKLYTSEDYSTTIEPFVKISSFKTQAEIEAIKLIDKASFELIKEDNAKIIWDIRSLMRSITVFFFTKEQEKEDLMNGLTHKLEDRLFEIIKINNEFDYLKRDNFKLQTDSKEVFDTVYNSNWYYYYK